MSISTVLRFFSLPGKESETVGKCTNLLFMSVCLLFLSSIQNLLEFAADMEIDIPHVWQNIAVVIGPLVAHGICHLERLVSVDHVQNANRGGVFAAAILAEVHQLKVREEEIN